MKQWYEYIYDANLGKAFPNEDTISQSFQKQLASMCKNTFSRLAPYWINFDVLFKLSFRHDGQNPSNPRRHMLKSITYQIYDTTTLTLIGEISSVSADKDGIYYFDISHDIFYEYKDYRKLASAIQLIVYYKSMGNNYKVFMRGNLRTNNKIQIGYIDYEGFICENEEKSSMIIK